MKKTLVALAVTAFAASASALTVYENDGSKVDFDGSIRLLLEKNSSKTNGATTKRAHSNLHNDGSRFGVRANHNLSDDLFAFGRLEFRFNGAGTTDQFSNVYAHRAYVGFGSKTYGELSFGRQVTIGDDIAQAGFDNAYGAFGTTLTTSGKSVVRYDYKGVEGLQVGVDYRFAEKRDNVGEVEVNELKSGYGAGVVYNFKVAENQSATVAAGYTRDHYVTGTSDKHHRDAWAAGAKYTINALTLAADYAGSFEKDGSTKDRSNGFRVGAKYQFTPAVAAYTNYGYAALKTKEAGETTEKTRIHKFMLGSEYKVHKNVFTYVEGSIARVKTTDVVDNDVTKSTDKAIGVGLRGLPEYT